MFSFLLGLILGIIIILLSFALLYMAKRRDQETCRQIRRRLKEMDIETRSRFLEIVMKEAKLESLEQADAATKAVLSLTKTIIGEELSQKIAACSPPDLREGWEAINVYFDEG